MAREAASRTFDAGPRIWCDGPHVIHRFPGAAESVAGPRLEWPILVVLVLQRVLPRVPADSGDCFPGRQLVG